MDASERVRCDVDRQRDAIYRMISGPDIQELRGYMHGIASLVDEHGTYKSLRSLTQMIRQPNPDPIVCRACFFMALYLEPAFLQFVMDLPDTCAANVSQFKHCVLGPIVTRILHGSCTLDVFVQKCTIGYITM